MKTRILSIITIILLSISASGQRKISTDVLQVKQLDLGSDQDSIIVADLKGNLKQIPQSTFISQLNLSNYVPYTGATQNVFLGSSNISGANSNFTGQVQGSTVVARGANPVLQINDTDVNGGNVNFKLEDTGSFFNVDVIVPSLPGKLLLENGDGSQLTNISSLSSELAIDVDAIESSKTSVLSIDAATTLNNPLFGGLPSTPKDGLVATFGSSNGAIQIVAEDNSTNQVYKIRKYNTTNGTSSYQDIFHTGNFNPGLYTLNSSFTSGTFTPTLVDTGGGATFSYSSQIGKYIKSNNVIHFYIEINISSQTGTSSGITRISGITPFNGTDVGTVSLDAIYGTSLTDSEITLIQPKMLSNSISFPSKSNGTEPVLNFSGTGKIVVRGTYTINSIN